MPAPAATDQQLLDLIKTGDPAAFTRLYDRYSHLLYTYAYRLYGERESAKDAVQELFIILWDKRELLDLSTSLAAYLYTAIRYRFLKDIDRRKVRTAYAERFQAQFQEAMADELLTEKELISEIEKTDRAVAA